MSGKFLARASALSLALFLAACGGDDSSTPLVNVDTGGGAQPEDGAPTTGDPGGVGDGETTETVALLGTGKGNSFNEKQLFVTAPAIQTEEPYEFELTLADPETKAPLLKSGQSVSYTSPCIDAGIASIEGPSSPDSGIIKAAYTSSACYGEDLVHAFIGNSSEPAAAGTVTIAQPAALELRWEAITQELER